MESPAKPSRILPKSNAHNAQTTTTRNAPTEGTTRPNPVPASTTTQTYHTADDFTYPQHVIPSRDYTSTENLVIVCCHAIFHPDISSPSFPLHSPLDESNWHLAPFQRSNPDTGKGSEHETFLAHALTGIDILSNESPPGSDPHSQKTLLVFSGGPTKRSLTPLSEARSYYHAVLAQELARGNPGGGLAHHFYSQGHILLEEHATDSFQNLLFSIVLYRRTTGKYPRQIRVITHAFKARRFLELHAPALRWPREGIMVQGIDPVMSATEREDTVSGEEKYGYAPWLGDPLGLGKMLAAKRKSRGWDEGSGGRLAEGLEESVKELFRGTVPSQLPWSAAETQETNADRAQ